MKESSLPDIHSILQRYWGHPQFRPLQEDIIRSILHGHDTLALLPTGGGKSICFQVPALAMPGICVVISPLIALMKDQVENLKRRGIAAAAIYSGMTYREVDATLDNCIYGKTKFLYISPERIKTELFEERVRKMNVNLIAVDESHCISQWGYDFRPSYLNIQTLREWLPHVPVMALTATATPEVVKDIQDKLGCKNTRIFQKSYARPNLIYVVLKDSQKLPRMLQLLQQYHGSTVIYARNRSRTQRLAQFLQEQGISADFYHAGIPSDERGKKQDDWIQNKFRVMVATNAFGMGIDKPDVRLVIHMDIPDTPEAYFQEAGRAGRDEKKAYGVLLVDADDVMQLQEQIELSYPAIPVIKKVYNSVCDSLQLATGSGAGQNYTINLTQIMQRTQLPSATVWAALQIIDRENYWKLNDTEKAVSKVWIHRPRKRFEGQGIKPIHQELIRTLLRSYEGLFEQYTRIDEVFLGRVLKIDTTQIRAILTELNTLDLLHYEPAKHGIQLHFLMDRLPTNHVYISPERYLFLKRRALEKMDAMVRYVNRTDKCRSRLLLGYFGETDSENCGKCDVCRAQNAPERFEQEYVQVLSQLSNLNEELYEKQQLALLIPSLHTHEQKWLRWFLEVGILQEEQADYYRISQTTLKQLSGKKILPPEDPAVPM